jgi:serine/threonine-protein kinase
VIGTTIGSYRVVSALGGGGVAEVYRVRHEVLGTDHALKVLKVPSDSARQRLVAEGRIQAQLEHPHVVSVRDVLDAGGAPALLLELVQGPTLGALIRAGLRSPDLVDSLGSGVLQGVAAAHARGLVHRDLKPGNVLVARRDGVLVPKVSDFGLARVLEEEVDARLTRSGASLGTPLYMAPEQVRDARRADARSDVWALGALLYELCCGEPPFDDTGDRLDLFRRIDDARPVPLEQRRPDAPAHWLAAVEAALQRVPAARPADAGELLQLWGRHPEAPVDDDLAALIDSLVPTDAHSGPDVPEATMATWGATLGDAGSVGAEAQATKTASTERGPPPADALPSVAELPQTIEQVPARSQRGWMVGTGVAVVLAAAAGWYSAQPDPRGQSVAAPSEAVAPAAVPVAPVPAPDGALRPAVPPSGPRSSSYAKALDDLLEVDPMASERLVSMIVAGADSESPDLLLAAAQWLCHDRGSMWSDLGRGRSWSDPSLRTGAWLHALTDPTAAPTPSSPQEWMLRALTTPGPVSDEVLDQLDAAAPARPLPALVRAQVRRRQGRLDDADAAVVAGRSLGATGSRWEAEEALVDWRAGRSDDALDHLRRATEADDKPPAATWLAALLVADALGDEALSAAATRALGRGSVYRQADAQLMLAAAAAERGEPSVAFERLDAAEALLQPYARTGEVNWHRSEVQLEALRIAVGSGPSELDRALDAAGRLRALTGEPLPGWATAEVQERAAAADALVALLRGVRGPAESLVEQVDPARSPVVHELLGEALEGRLEPRVRAYLLP